MYISIYIHIHTRVFVHVYVYVKHTHTETDLSICTYACMQASIVCPTEKPDTYLTAAPCRVPRHCKPKQRTGGFALDTSVSCKA